MKILLVNPRNTEGRNLIIIPNIGLGYLSSAARRAGHQVDIVDCVRDNISPDRLVKIAKGGDHDLVGFSIFTPAWGPVKRYLRALKEELGDVITVVGGSHPTFEPEETLKGMMDADYGFSGEAEVGFPGFLQMMENSDTPTSGELVRIPGLLWRENGSIRKNPGQLLQPLDDNPMPDWAALKPDRYPLAPNGVFSRNRRVAPLLTTRGCPFHCTFCGSGKMQGDRIRKRNEGNILEEILLLRDHYGIGELHVMDDNFTLDRKFALSLCRRISDAKLGVCWSCTSGVRLDTLNEELLQAMERAGCYSFAVGIESGSDKVLSDMKKSLTTSEIREKISLIRRCSKIRITGFFIIGYPTETLEDVEKTIRFARELKIDRANFFNFTPFPGSPIYYELKESGQLGDLDYDHLYIHTLNYEHPRIERSQMQGLLRKAYFRFYGRPRILYGLMKEVKSLLQIWIICKRAAAILSRGKGQGESC